MTDDKALPGLWGRDPRGGEHNGRSDPRAGEHSGWQTSLPPHSHHIASARAARRRPARPQAGCERIGDGAGGECSGPLPLVPRRVQVAERRRR